MYNDDVINSDKVLKLRDKAIKRFQSLKPVDFNDSPHSIDQQLSKVTKAIADIRLCNTVLKFEWRINRLAAQDEQGE